jgi:hypothetical protein
MSGYYLVVFKTGVFKGHPGIAWETDDVWKVSSITHVFVLDSRDEVEFVSRIERIKELVTLIESERLR